MSEKRVSAKEYDNQTLTESGKKLFRVSDIADAYFVLATVDGSYERIPAHKTLLAVASDVFKAMFYGPLKEEGDVHLDDVTVAAFEEFLQFFYIGRVKLTVENVTDVMHLCHKYNVVKCFDLCVRFIEDTLADDNACTGLSLAILYDSNDSQKLCKQHISINTDAVFKSSSFLECNQQVLKHILSMNLLSCSASGQDVLSKEIVQTHLGDQFYEIRFASMTVEEFASLTDTYGCLFTADEYKEIIQMIALPESQPKMFNKHPRQVEWNDDDVITCNCAGHPNNFSLRLSKTETTAFTTNQPVLLGSFECQNLHMLRDGEPQELTSNVPVTVQVLEYAKSSIGNKMAPRILCKQKASLWSKTDTTIWLNKLVLIRPGFLYEIRLTQSPEGHYYTSKLMKTEVKVDFDITMKFRGRFISLITSLDFNRI